MTRIELIKGIEAAAQAIQHGQIAAVGTFRPSDVGTDVPDKRYAAAGAVLGAAEDGLRQLAQFLAPTVEEFREAGIIDDEGCWGGAGIWSWS